MSGPYADVRVADPERARLIRSVFEPSSLDEVAEAVSVATGHETEIYVEKVGDLWRWSLTHTGSGYPLLRISARFLKMDYQRIFIGFRTVKGGYSILTKDPEEKGSSEWAILKFEGPTPVDEVRERIGAALE